jgi:protein-disulfide isomerase
MMLIEMNKSHPRELTPQPYERGRCCPYRPLMTNCYRIARAAGPRNSRRIGDSIVGMNANPATAPALQIPRGANADGDGIVVGAGAAVVEAYIDFQCPFCKQFELMAGPTLDGLLVEELITYSRHPMNFLDAVSTTGYSTRAAAASAAASDAGMFHEYARALFEYQPPEGGPGLSDGQLVELGQNLGITDPAFPETIRRGSYLPWPSFVTERAVARGIAGTPSVFVGGIPVAARPGPILAAVQRVLS